MDAFRRGAKLLGKVLLGLNLVLLVLFSATMLRLYLGFHNKVRLEFTNPIHHFTVASLPSIQVAHIEEMSPEKVLKKNLKSKKIAVIKSPSYARSKNEYLAYEQFRESNKKLVEIEDSILHINKKISKSEKLILSWVDYFSAPILNENKSLYAFIDSLIDQQNVEPIEANLISDQVTTALSSVRNDGQEAVKNESDEIIEYNLASETKDNDSSTPEHPFNKSQPVSKRVDDVISRMLAPVQQREVVPFKRQNFTPAKKPLKTITIQAYDFENEEKIENFSYTSLSDEQDITNSDKNEVVLEFLCEKACGQIQGTLEFKNGIRTIVSVGIPEADKFNIEVPVIQPEKYEQLLADFGISSGHGTILVRTNEALKGVTIDKSYLQKLTLDKNGKLVDSDSTGAYILFLGVTPGIASISYNYKEQWAFEMQSVHADAVTYYKPLIMEGSERILTFTLQESLGMSRRSLELSTNDLKSFDKSEQISQITYNQFNIKNTTSVEGYRQYHQVVYDRYSTFFGYNTKDKSMEISLPSSDFKSNVLSYLGVDELKNQCVIQVNTNGSRPEKVDFLFHNLEGQFEKIEMLALDEDGTFSRSITPTSGSLIFTSEIPGTLNIKITNLDGKVQFLNSFCVQDTYLVEHL